MELRAGIKKKISWSTPVPEWRHSDPGPSRVDPEQRRKVPSGGGQPRASGPNTAELLSAQRRATTTAQHSTGRSVGKRSPRGRLCARSSRVRSRPSQSGLSALLSSARVAVRLEQQVVSKAPPFTWGSWGLGFLRGLLPGVSPRDRQCSCTEAGPEQGPLEQAVCSLTLFIIGRREGEGARNERPAQVVTQISCRALWYF